MPARKSKPIADMSEAELEREGKRLHAQLRRTQEEDVRIARAQLARRRATLGGVLRSKPRRPRWK